MKTDIQIAREAKLERINAIAERMGIPADDVYNYGPYMAKAHRHCLGIYYWEPESSMQWNHYPLGAFSNGSPTAIMDAWAN